MDVVEGILNQKDYTSLNVLVVEDEDEIRELVCRQIRRDIDPHSIIEAKDGVEALQKLSMQSFDLIILDLKMPKKSGIEVIRFLKDKPKTSSIPIIVISGALDESVISQMVKWGIKNVLTKPFNPKLLLESIEKLTGNEI